LKNFYICLSMIICIMTLFSGCDSIYPTEQLKVEEIKTLSQGESADIELVYPDTGGTIVLKWRNESAEVIDGKDVVVLSGFTVKGVKPGIATIKVKAITVISEEARAEGYKEKEYCAEVKVNVE